jgi:hypothetical protein
VKHTELTEQQRQELESWLQKGFSDYAGLCGKGGDHFAADAERRALDMAKIYNYTQAELDGMFYRGNIHRNIGIQVKKYAPEFLAVLRDEVELSEDDDPLALRRGLYTLMERGFPALALVDLMLACTCDYGITFLDILMFADPLQRYLDRIKENLDHFRYPKRPRRFKDPVPLSLEFLMEAKSHNFRPTASMTFHLAYFYTFLKRFGGTHETLGQLLRVMRHVRLRAPVVADYLKIRGKGRLNGLSLQRRVLRFFESQPSLKRTIRKDVRDYLGPNVDKRKTLFTNFESPQPTFS